VRGTYLALLSGEFEFRLSGLPCLLLPLGLLCSRGSGTLGLFTSVDPGLGRLGLSGPGLSLGLGSGFTTLGLSLGLLLSLSRLSSSLTCQLRNSMSSKQTDGSPLLLWLGSSLFSNDTSLVEDLLVLLRVSGSLGGSSSLLACLSPLGNILLGPGQFKLDSSVTECCLSVYDRFPVYATHSSRLARRRPSEQTRQKRIQQRHIQRASCRT